MRVLLVLAILLGWLPIGAAAMTLDSIMAAADGEDWSTAEHRAAMLDASEGQGDFYSAYVRARKLAGEGRCGEAVLIFDLLTLTRPYFTPAYEGAFLCLHAMGEVDAAIGRLDGLLAVLQEGPHRDLVFQIRQGLDAGDRPVFNVFGSIVPSSNANRQTGETSFGSWQIAPEAQGRAGVMVNLGGSVTKRLLSHGHFALSGVARVEADYNSTTEMLEPRFTLEAPMTFGAPQSTAFLVSPLVTLALGDDAITHAKAGLRGVVSVPLTESLSTTLSGTVGYSTYPTQSWRSGWEYELRLAANWVVSPQTMVTAALSARWDATDMTENSRTQIMASARIDHAMESGLLLGVQSEAGIRMHASPPPLSTGANQQDQFAAIQFDASHRDIRIGPFMPQVYYRYAVQASDNVFYQYHSHDVGVTLRSSF